MIYCCVLNQADVLIWMIYCCVLNQADVLIWMQIECDTLSCVGPYAGGETELVCSAGGPDQGLFSTRQTLHR